VPEYIEDGKVINLHKLNMKYENQTVFANEDWIHTKMTKFMNENIDHSQMVDLAVEFYENGMSCLDFIKWIERTDFINGFIKTEILMKFDKIKSEYRCEKLLLLYLFDSFRQILKNV
jgi:hypothetical protein